MQVLATLRQQGKETRQQLMAAEKKARHDISMHFSSFLIISLELLVWR